ncbi:TPA: hypothetical protein ACS778_003595 [Providencia alcalifaciens]
MSGGTSQISLIDRNNAHQQKFTSVIPQGSSISLSTSKYHPYSEQNSVPPISSSKYLKVKKRSIDNIENNKEDSSNNANVKYSLSKDNIEDRIFNHNSKKKQYITH